MADVNSVDPTEIFANARSEPNLFQVSSNKNLFAFNLFILLWCFCVANAVGSPRMRTNGKKRVENSTDAGCVAMYHKARKMTASERSAAPRPASEEGAAAEEKAKFHFIVRHFCSSTLRRCRWSK